MIPFNDCMSPMERDMRQNQEHMKAMRELEELKQYIIKIVEDYIKSIDTKTSSQDLKIQNTVIYIKDHVEEVASEILTKALDEGKITLQGIYDPETESLTIGGDISG